MQKMASALTLIILGLVVLAFPVLGVIPFSLVTGFIVLILGIGLVLSGTMEIGESAVLGILELILGIIAMFLGIGFIVNPGLFSWLAGFLIWLAGFFLIIAGIMGLISETSGSRWNGVIAIIMGVIYIIVGTFIANPTVLGALIGIWLIITGIMMLLMKD
ncbi:DUF308 domain-containing protein [Methanobacterium aggregans]|uniref:DUF308 domain-containing protein n=1 Tax=Methanobacterium aggregans TaxID=1615586 RepID=UPI001AEA3482|nr:DUF308 domain-containing protein [Methanobacterium aggregans]MBP2045642.1 uncharacterized membrane protein HdeD (DUF308 family) [Methanobacterium aggregans]